MAWWDDVWSWIGDTWNEVVDWVSNAIQWLADRLNDIKIALAKAVAWLIENPFWGFVAAIALGVAMVFITTLVSLPVIATWLLAAKGSYDLLMSIVTNVAETIQLALLIELSNIAAFTSQTWNEQLSKLYKALASLAKSLNSIDSFFVFFGHVARVELQAMNMLSPNGVTEAAMQHADGMIRWLKDLSGNLNKYSNDPSQIFNDIQTYLINDQLQKTDDNQKLILAQIAAGAMWIEKTGSAIVSTVDDLIKEASALDERISAVINVWYIPLKKQFDDFNKKVWAPFQNEYNRLSNVIIGALSKQGLSVTALEARIKTPADFFKMITTMGDLSSETQIAIINNILSGNLKKRLLKLAEKVDGDNVYRNPYLDLKIEMRQYKTTVPDFTEYKFPKSEYKPKGVYDSLFAADNAKDLPNIMTKDD
jgi:hypothetical protein